MAKLAKKTKQQKTDDLERCNEYLSKYDTVIFIENNSMLNTCFKALRELLVSGKIMVVKKSLFQRMFSEINFQQDYFLAFVNEEEINKIKEFQYKAFMEAGDIAPETHIIKSGKINPPKLIDYLSPIENEGANSILLEDFTVCEKDDKISAKQAEILKILGKRLIFKPLNVLDIKKSKDMIKTG